MKDELNQVDIDISPELGSEMTPRVVTEPVIDRHDTTRSAGSVLKEKVLLSSNLVMTRTQEAATQSAINMIKYTSYNVKRTGRAMLENAKAPLNVVSFVRRKKNQCSKLLATDAKWSRILKMQFNEPVILLETFNHKSFILSTMALYFTFVVFLVVTLEPGTAIVKSIPANFTVLHRNCNQANCFQYSATSILPHACDSISTTFVVNNVKFSTATIKVKELIVFSNDHSSSQFLAMIENQYKQIEKRNHTVSLLCSVDSHICQPVKSEPILLSYKEFIRKDMEHSDVEAIAEPIQMNITFEYELPYKTFMVDQQVTCSVNKQVYKCALSGFLTVLNIIVFAYFIRRTHKSKVKMIQWKWIKIAMLGLFLWDGFPFKFYEYISLNNYETSKKTIQVTAYAVERLGKDMIFFSVLLFADGMCFRYSIQSQFAKFYTYKLLSIILLGISQAVSFWYLLDSRRPYVLLVRRTIHFYVNCVYPLALLFYKRQYIKRFSYRSYQYQYKTYGFVFIGVLVLAITSLVDYILGIFKNLNIIYPGTRIDLGKPVEKSFIGALLTPHILVYATLFSYLPTTSQDRNIDKMEVEIDCHKKHKEVMLYESEFLNSSLKSGHEDYFCMQTAAIMLNASITIYYDPSSYKNLSASACGRMGEDILSFEEQGYREIEFFHDAASDTSAILVEGSDRYILAFRGTGSSKNALTDLQSHLTRFKRTEKKMRRKSVIFEEKVVRVHTGFYKAYLKIQENIRTAVLKLAGHSSKTLFITGHSLGGALASICAVDLSCFIEAKLNRKVKIIMYNFGSPRAGNKAFAHLFNARISGFRVVNDGDFIVSSIKRDYTGIKYTGIRLYKHVGLEVVILSKKHNSTQIQGILISPDMSEKLLILKARKYPQHHGLDAYRKAFREQMDNQLFEYGDNKINNAVEETECCIQIKT